MWVSLLSTVFVPAHQHKLRKVCFRIGNHREGCMGGRPASRLSDSSGLRCPNLETVALSTVFRFGARHVSAHEIGFPTGSNPSFRWGASPSTANYKLI